MHRESPARAQMLMVLHTRSRRPSALLRRPLLRPHEMDGLAVGGARKKPTHSEGAKGNAL